MMLKRDAFVLYSRTSVSQNKSIVQPCTCNGWSKLPAIISCMIGYKLQLARLSHLRLCPTTPTSHGREAVVELWRTNMNSSLDQYSISNSINLMCMRVSDSMFIH